MATPDISQIPATATAPEVSTDLLGQRINNALSAIIPGQMARIIDSLRQEINDICSRIPMPDRQTPTSGQSSSSAGTGQYMDSMREPFSPSHRDMEEHGMSPPPYNSNMAHYSVHPRAYRTTSDEVVKTCKALKITSNGSDLLRKIDAFNAALRITNLEKLLNGDRIPPVQTLLNPIYIEKTRYYE